MANTMKDAIDATNAVYRYLIAQEIACTMRNIEEVNTDCYKVVMHETYPVDKITSYQAIRVDERWEVQA